LSKNSKSWGNGTIFAEADKFAPRFPARPGSIEDSRAVSGSVAEPILGGLPVAIVYFENSSSVLTSESKNRIRKAYQLYQNTSRGPIHVVGHASSRTPNLGQSKHQLANFNISNKRANSVVKELISLGVDPRLILMSGMSDHRPAFLEVMPAGEAGNRRAEIYFNQ
jgi:outer membrane protein OmpA-like peptidoglycan-associated protein